MAYDATDLAYLAGLMDADGHFNVCRSQARVALKVGMMDTEAVEWLQATFGGSIWTQRAALGKKFYVWNLVRRAELLALIPQFLPYLRIKQSQARAMLELLEHVANQPSGLRGRRGHGHSHTYMKYLDYRFREFELREAVQVAR